MRNLVYAPLAGLLIRVNVAELKDLENAALGLPASEESVELWNRLRAKEPVLECSTPESIDELTILLNQRCNFSCSYCYSAKGRSNAELDMPRISHVLDFFINRKRGRNLKIVFSGGGDPILSFNRFQEAVSCAEKCAEKQNVELVVGIVTNGSTLKDEYIRYLKEHQVQVVLSFDVLKDVHNKQRSHFDTVVNTICRMTEAGLPFGLRCTITPLNVCRQNEMVETLHRDFPKVKSAAFEAVLSRELFKNEKDQETFYDFFVRHFFKAQALAEQYGIEIGNTIANSVECCKIRACLGKFVVTPEGSFMACSRSSMPKEPYYDLFKYGNVDATGLHIDHFKYNQLMEKNAEYYVECGTCIARWHCGGGCLLARQILTGRMSSYCRFMRRMIIETLKRRT